MSRVTTSHTRRPAIRAIGWSTLALLATGIAPGAAALGHCGDARPPAAPAAVRGVQACATVGAPFGLERFLCYRAAANLANERYAMPPTAVGGGGAADASTGAPRYGPTSKRVRAEDREERAGGDQTAEATSGIGSAVGTGVSRSGSATRQ
jgi:hypothetical protein